MKTTEPTITIICPKCNKPIKWPLGAVKQLFTEMAQEHIAIGESLFCCPDCEDCEENGTEPESCMSIRQTSPTGGTVTLNLNGTEQYFHICPDCGKEVSITERDFFYFLHEYGVADCTPTPCEDCVARNKASYDGDPKDVTAEVLVDYPEAFDWFRREGYICFWMEGELWVRDTGGRFEDMLYTLFYAISKKEAPDIALLLPGEIG